MKQRKSNLVLLHLLKFTFSQRPSRIGYHNFQAEGEKIHGLCLPLEDLTMQSETNMHTKASSWQERENTEECFMRVKEEPSASKFHGLHADPGGISDGKFL